MVKRVLNLFETATYQQDRQHITFKDGEVSFRVNLKKGRVESEDPAVEQRVWPIISNLFPK